ncbi:MAG TPA: DUF4272 domain-containing protein [Pseudobacteroides sp.]|nr:DUF4272 domain-containing protein [Pseudobacteroides sp.]
MKNVTIYSASKNVTKIVNNVIESFKDKKLELFENPLKIKITYKNLFSGFSINFNFMSRDTEKSKFEDMLKGMFGFYQRVSTQHEQIKSMLLTQIQFFNTCVGIVCEKDINDDIFRRILNTLDSDDMVFLPSGDMLNRDGKIIFNLNGESDVKELRVTASTDILDSNIKETQSALDRKSRSLEILKQRNIPFITRLPVIVSDEDVQIRPKEEVAKRAIALAIISTYAADLANKTPRNECKELLDSLTDRFSAWGFFTEEERNFINGDPDEITIIQFAWKYECLWVFLWALGFIKDLDYPDKICDVSEAISYLKDEHSFESFLNKSSLIPPSQILDQADLIYRYDWACVDARLKNSSPPGGLDSGVVLERHRALNWLISYMNFDWDNVRTDT